MELKKRQILGQTESSVSMVFPPSFDPRNRLVADVFQLTFSCNFDFAGFPFDFQECPIKYGDALLGQERMMFNTTLARFGNLSTKSGGDPIIIDNLPFPFEFQIVALPTFELYTRSYAGVVLKMKRNTKGYNLLKSERDALLKSNEKLSSEKELYLKNRISNQEALVNYNQLKICNKDLIMVSKDLSAYRENLTVYAALPWYKRMFFGESTIISKLSKK